MSSALLAGAVVLGTSVTDAESDVVASSLGQVDIFGSAVEFSDSPLVKGSTVAPLSLSNSPALASAENTASNFTANVAQLELPADLLEHRGTAAEAIFPIIKASKSTTTNGSLDRSRSTQGRLNLLVDSNNLASTTLTRRNEMLFVGMQHEIGNDFRNGTNNALIVDFIDTAYRTKSILISNLRSLASPSNIGLLCLGLAGVGYIRRRPHS